MDELNNPKIGEIVLYWVSPTDPPELRHNYASVLPAVIVQAWTDVTVNLKVITDGPTDVWKTSVVFGESEGHWSRPSF